MRMHWERADGDLQRALLSLEDHIKAELAATPFVDVPESFATFRHRALTASAGELGVAPTEGDEPWLVVVDFGYPDAAVSMIAAEGGLAWVGIEGHRDVLRVRRDRRVMEAVRQLLEMAAADVSAEAPDSVVPLPPPGSVSFCVREGDRVRSELASARELLKGGHDLSPLFRAALAVVEVAREKGAS